MSKTNKNTMDMTHGTLWNKILIFALPLAASSILQQLFNSIDTAVVGRFASSQALAAVGSNSSLIALMINLFIGISLGSNVVIAHYIGQRSEKNIQAAIHTAIVVALVSGIFVMIEADSGFADHMETGVFLKGEFYDRNRMSGRRKRNAF